LVPARELVERLSFAQLIARHLAEARGWNAEQPPADLLQQSVYSQLAGYEDLNEAARRLFGSTRRKIAASPPPLEWGAHATEQTCDINGAVITLSRARSPSFALIRLVVRHALARS
jgi:hypothetical protein